MHSAVTSPAIASSLRSTCLPQRPAAVHTLRQKAPIASCANALSAFLPLLVPGVARRRGALASSARSQSVRRFCVAQWLIRGVPCHGQSLRRSVRQRLPSLRALVSPQSVIGGTWL